MNNKIQDLNIKLEYDTKYEQVDASVRFVLQDNKAYYDTLASLPNRVQAAILTMVIDWLPPIGYHFMVLRAAQKQYSRGSGVITADEPPFTYDEMTQGYQ